uniref:GPR180/TMEM145 transmembrane domain-containing protein n=1 Tax=Panagrolaimus sp. PS1159 TaxID=55785 RepID=A0AC35ET51_9BILA
MDEPVHIISRFGIQQLNPLNAENTKGFIYGNVTYVGENISVNENNRAALIIVPESQIKTILMESEYAASCGTMLKNFSQIAFEAKCLSGGRRSDMLRWAPCKKDGICEEEDKPKLIIPGYQFTFRIDEPIAPEYWYILLLSCTLNDKCNWTTSTRNYQIEYDIWLINGNNAFSKQFSYEEQDIIHIYMFALLMYIALALGQLRATSLIRQNVLPRRQRLINTVIGLKIAGLILQATDTYIFAFFGKSTVLFMFVGELCRVCAISTDTYIFAFFGKSTVLFMFVGELCRVCAICCLILLLLLLSRGWAIQQRSSIAYSNRVHYFWCLLTTIHIILFIYGFITPKAYLKTNTFDFLSNRGLVILRLVQGLWFFIEIKRTIKREPDDERIVFLVHFGAAYMVWFVYLLGLGVIAAFISEIWRLKIVLEIWRLKIVLAISTFANFVAIACLVHLFWPTGSNRKFFVHDGHYHHHLERTSSTELEDFEKALICDDTDDDEVVVDSKL